MDNNNGNNASGSGAASSPGNANSKPMVSMMRQGGQAQMSAPIATTSTEHGGGPAHGMTPGPGAGTAQNGAGASELMNSRK